MAPPSALGPRTGSPHHYHLSTLLHAVLNFQAPDPRVVNTPALSQIFEPIRGDLELVDREFVRHVEPQVAVIPQIGRYIQTSGGKRVRPAVLLMAARLSGYQGDRAVPYAAVV